MGRSYDRRLETSEAVLRRMDRLGIERALACPFRPLDGDMRAANAALALSLRAHPDRLVGAARVDPWQPEAAAMLRQALSADVFRAVFLHPWEENFPADLDLLDAVAEIACDRRAPVLIATGYPWVASSLQVATLARRWPNVPFVMTNGGQINISGLGQANATLALQETPNLSLDTSGVYRQDFLEETIAQFGPERVLFASGAPYFDQEYEQKRIGYLQVNESARQAISGGNAERMIRA